VDEVHAVPGCQDPALQTCGTAPAHCLSEVVHWPHWPVDAMQTGSGETHAALATTSPFASQAVGVTLSVHPTLFGRQSQHFVPVGAVHPSVHAFCTVQLVPSQTSMALFWHRSDCGRQA
jgi:hypothetical protein